MFQVFNIIYIHWVDGISYPDLYFEDLLVNIITAVIILRAMLIL